MINSVDPLAVPDPLTGDDGAGSWSGAAVAGAFADAVESGWLNLPLPGGGRTRERWAVLAELAGADLCLARLAEGHADALAILAELGAGPPPAGSRWGVWAAQPPGPGLTASKSGGDWLLDGTKQYCSGARSCTDALVTATAPDGWKGLSRSRLRAQNPLAYVPARSANACGPRGPGALRSSRMPPTHAQTSPARTPCVHVSPITVMRTRFGNAPAISSWGAQVTWTSAVPSIKSKPATTFMRV